MYSKKYGVPFEGARELLTKKYDELGDEVVEWYDIKYWFDRFELGDGWMKLLASYGGDIELFPEVENVLRRCKQSYDMILITNDSREFAEIETTEIRGYFTRIISSVSDFGEVKKTPEFYGKVCRLLRIKPWGLIHVGDHWQFDFIAPRNAGLTAYYLDRTGGNAGEFTIRDLNELMEKLELGSINE